MMDMELMKVLFLVHIVFQAFLPLGVLINMIAFLFSLLNNEMKRILLHYASNHLVSL